ncbi:NAD(+)/NADH kinase [Natrinema halophilum]|uniref:NAD(+)/NADH kinase n=1 Tax=Natrinema halophilum TaxID=1699371 RepID=A0A7D5KTN7_9EURY|nr:NAD(+)/NADH kinase [Natrinema halophilum]QLG50724.1 NAD(+)/NADH kinase [Natrinema halophilum]
MDVAWSADEEPVVGVVDRGRDAGDAVQIDDSLESTLTDATIVRGSRNEVLAAGSSVLVIAGEEGVSAAARAGVETPVLPVGSITGIESVDRDRVSDALREVLDGHAIRRTRPVLSVTRTAGPKTERGTESDDGSGCERALFDVTLVTDEPARISEYGVHSRGSSVATFRADGVVAATPAGSHGYASDIDAPQLSTAIDALTVAPIGPFITQTRRWVLPEDDLALTIEREEGDVTLVVDGHAVGAVSVDSRVTVAATGTLPTLVVPDEGHEER